MAFMKVLAGEGAPHGILVNGMLVGLIDSDQHVRRHAREGANVSYDEFRAKMGANVPIGRIGKAEEFAAMACFLCSDHAGFTTRHRDQHGRRRLACGVTPVIARSAATQQSRRRSSQRQWTFSMAKIIPVATFDCVVFGATGDLTLRKLLPALYYRFRDGQMPPESHIIAAARSDLDDDAYRKRASKALREHVAREDLDTDTADRFCRRSATSGWTRRIRRRTGMRWRTSSMRIACACSISRRRPIFTARSAATSARTGW